jgi:SSS family solute:Na+ symporter
MTGEVASSFKGHLLDYVVIIAYFIGIIAFGVWFGKYARSTKDFFLGGQRFAWWLVAFSGIATTVGSYSFIKYSQQGYSYGISSSQTYLNDWFWIPILLLVWLPIIYFGRIQSIPEYFERRFGSRCRHAATFLILLYLIGNVGVNLYTLGQAMETLLGWPVMLGASLSAFAVMIYMFAGGQTSVIMTDLIQGLILVLVGIGILMAGLWHFGGIGEFWAMLPTSHRYAFSELLAPDDFSAVGIYAQDGLANTGAFILTNQGMMMRFLAIRSVAEARKMAVFWILFLMPLAAITVSSGGWVASALSASGELKTEAKHSFIDAAFYLCPPGIFGFVLAALTAALMSTADTLITAISAIFVNDVYRPYLRPNREDRHYLRVARMSSTVTVFTGIALVPVFMQSGSIYQAHAMFTAAVTPPIVVAVLWGIFAKRFTPAAALATMVGGAELVALSFIPGLQPYTVKLFAFGMGEKSYDFMRALYGIVVCGLLGFVVMLFTKPRPASEIVGLVNGTQLDAMRAFKGGEINRRPGKRVYLRVVIDPALGDSFDAVLPASAMQAMAADAGDLIYVCDKRWWFGGLRSEHMRVGESGNEGEIRIGRHAAVHGHLHESEAVFVEKVM